mmetsp:Transcript_11345/g.18493  ORF Transcript_11345/g.18493 Transcript_11345/m.18493 type:complete len:198 (+) Transcript_11345:1-594(+)
MGFSADVELQDELKAYSKSSAQYANAAKTSLTRSGSYHHEDDSRSALFIHGKQSVCSLYSVLLNRIVKRNGAHDVPKLLSPVLFENSASRCSSFRGVTTVTTTMREGGGKKRGTKVVLPFSGVPLPGNLAAFSSAVGLLHPEHKLDIKLEKVAQTRYINETLCKGLESAYPQLKEKLVSINSLTFDGKTQIFQRKSS